MNFDGRTIDINKARGADGMTTTKTYSSKRRIAIDNRTVSILKELKLSTINNAPIDCLFYNEYDNPMSPVNVLTVFKTILKNINYGHDKPIISNITVHGLRHTHTTHLLEAGANVKHVSARLGHKNITTTLNTYAHVLKEKEAETADLFGEFMDNL